MALVVAFGTVCLVLLAITSFVAVSHHTGGLGTILQHDAVVNHKLRSLMRPLDAYRVAVEGARHAADADSEARQANQAKTDIAVLSSDLRKLQGRYARMMRAARDTGGERSPSAAQERKGGCVKKKNNNKVVDEDADDEGDKMMDHIDDLHDVHLSTFPASPLTMKTARLCARQGSTEDFSRLKARRCTAMAWVFIPAYCFAIS